MRRLRRVAAAAASALAVAACRDAGTPTEPQSAPSYSQADQGYLGAHVHRMPVKSQAQEAHADAKPGGRGGGSGTGIFYHGGPVLTAAAPSRVAVIYWSAAGSGPIYAGGPTPGSGAGSAGADGSLIGTFLRNLGGSDYFRLNTTYFDGSNAPVANNVNYVGYYADATNAPTGTANVSDAQIQAEIERAMVVYPNDQHTIYIVMSAGAVNLGGGFGTQYCAYHGHFTSSSGEALFAVQPYNYAYPSACTSGLASVNNDPAADAEVSTLAHEIEETATDPFLNAWYDRRGYENADKCAWTWGTTTTASNGGVWNVTLGTTQFLIQRNWINSGSGGCYKGLTSSGAKQS